MSLETWRQEYYPETAAEIAERGASEAELVEHALRKFRGLRRENLSRHGIGLTTKRYVNVYVGRTKDMPITGNTCSLCQRHKECEGCPIAGRKEQAGLGWINEPCGREFWHFISTLDPEPMIALLERVLAHVRAQEAKP